jgi:hypothetical protein
VEYESESKMETVNLQMVIEADGHIRLDLPCGLPPGPAEVVVVIRPTPAAGPSLHWRDYYGLGMDIWGREDAQDYVNRLRDE